VNPLAQILRLGRYSPWHYLGSGTLVVLSGYLLPLVPGLVLKELLDTLVGKTAGWDVLTLLVLLAAARIARTLVDVGITVSEPSINPVFGALLRHNMLERILERPGARPLPATTGEAIGRFRNDVEEIGFYLAWTLDPLGLALSFLVGLAVLWSIDRSMTLFVFLPLLAVLALVNTTRGRVRAYRQANQQAIGEVTGLLGELFGAAVAVKVAGAERRVVGRPWSGLAPSQWGGHVRALPPRGVAARRPRSRCS
jgi:ATP-binding cassette subfamily B protein